MNETMTAAAKADHGVWAHALNDVEPRQVYEENVNPDRELNRWLFFPGNVIEPKRARELRHLRQGGIELDSICLRRFKGLVPRLRFTPLEMMPEWMPQERIPEGMAAVAAPKLQIPQTFGEESVHLLLMAKGRTPGVKIYPGDALTALLADINNDPRGRRGVVEITAFKGHVMEDSQMGQEAQLHFFDGAPHFADERAQEPLLPAEWPETLNAIRQKIESRKVTESTFRLIAEEMLGACDDFYWWGSRVINEAVQLGKSVNKNGYINTLPPLVRLLSDQLEIPLEEDQLRLLGQSLNRQPATPAPVVQTEDMGAVFKMLMEERAESKVRQTELEKELADLRKEVQGKVAAAVAPKTTVPSAQPQPQPRRT